MNASTSDSTRSAWILLPPIAGLAAAAWLSWEICPLTAPGSMTALVSEAIVYVLAAPLFSTLVIWYLYQKMLPGAGLNLVQVLSQSGIIAVLFPPLVLLSFQRSGWFVFLTVLMVVGVGGLVGMLRPPADLRTRLGAESRELFRLPEPRSPLIQFGPASAGALCLHLSIVAYAINERFMTAAFLAGATLLLSRVRTESLRKKYSGQTMSWKMALSGSLSVVLTIAALMHWFVLRRPVPPDSWAIVIVRLLFQDEPMKPQVAQRATRPPDFESHGSDGLYSGVILWDREPRAIMLAPPLPELYPQTFNDKPVGIAFSGYYSFFKPPFRHAPRNSTRMRGTPVKIGLRSSDDDPLLMEAHQDFGNLVDLDCCRKVQLVIRNSESRAAPVSCEMLLADTSVPAGAAYSLGSEPVPSEADLGERQQVLTFMVPRSGTHRRFNEITIRYHLSGPHAASSARVAIDKFIFVP